MKFSRSFGSAFVGAGLAVPQAWLEMQLADEYIGPLQAAAWLASGAVAEFSSEARPVVNGRVLIGSAGSVFRFEDSARLAKWSEIAASRALRELWLAHTMSQSSREAWLAKKQAALDRAAVYRVRAAVRIEDLDVKNALVCDASFALQKWAFYA